MTDGVRGRHRAAGVETESVLMRLDHDNDMCIMVLTESLGHTVLNEGLGEQS